MPDTEELLTKEDKVKIKRCLYALQRNGLPPITTHNVVDDWNDPVLSAVRRCYLFNTVHDRVKVRKFIYVVTYGKLYILLSHTMESLINKVNCSALFVNITTNSLINQL